MRLISLVLALLLIPLFAASAGAIYIEGQAPQTYDDGQMHIMAAESGLAGDAPVPTLYDENTAGEPIDAVPISATVTLPTSGVSGLNGRVPSMFTVPTIGGPRLSGSLGGLAGIRAPRVPTSVGHFNLGTIGLTGNKVSAPCIFA